MKHTWMKVAAMGAAVILGAVSCLAESYNVGDTWWQYKVSGGMATVTSWSSSSSSTYLSVPSTINGYSVGAVNFWCTGVKDVYIPYGVTSVERVGSYTVETIFIPSTVTSIGDYAFYGCWDLRSLSIPNGVTKLGNYVFYDCYSLTSITLPSSLTSLGDYTFYYCTNLTSITIPSTVKTIGEGCFSSCQKLTKVVVPDSVGTIGHYAFGYCKELTSITLPSGLKKLNGSTFQMCSELSAVTLPKTLTCIGDFEFAWCSKLKTLTVPDKVTSIGKKAFYECDSITSITIPSSVTSIGTEAFGGCSALSVVYVDSESEKSRVKSLMSTAGCYVSSVEFRVRSGGGGNGGGSGGGDGGGSGGNTQTTCTVTFNANGGKVSTSSRSYTVGSSYGTLPTPTRSGYEFDGWYTSSSGGTYISSYTKVTGRITLYAHWSKDWESVEWFNWQIYSARTLSGYVMDGDQYVGTIQIKAAKAKYNRRTGCTITKFTATVQVLGEKKVSLKGEYNFCYWYPYFTMETRDGHELNLYNGDESNSFAGTYDGYDIAVKIDNGAKKSHALNRGAAFWMDTTEFSELLGDDTYEEYLPDGIDVTVKGTKWVLPKAGRVVYNRKYDWIDESKLGDNPSGLKLTFKSKDGTFKGSFKAYREVKGRPKATTVSVTGFVVDGVGYGIATIKKVGSVPIIIE